MGLDNINSRNLPTKCIMVPLVHTLLTPDNYFHCIHLFRNAGTFPVLLPEEKGFNLVPEPFAASLKLPGFGGSTF